jgi:hypothetical protein
MHRGVPESLPDRFLCKVLWHSCYCKAHLKRLLKDQPLLSSKRRPHYRTYKRSSNEQKLVHKSRRGPKSITTLLARASSNLLDLNRKLLYVQGSSAEMKQRFRALCCLHLQDRRESRLGMFFYLKTGAQLSSETLEPIHLTTRNHIPEDSIFIVTVAQNVISQKKELFKAEQQYQYQISSKSFN